jgi:hypothetical protein
MARCDTCGNDYDKAFEIRIGGQTFTFDCFECAVHRLAPECLNCGCRVLGHGLEEGGAVYCCASCARAGGVTRLRDRADAPLIAVTSKP